MRTLQQLQTELDGRRRLNADAIRRYDEAPDGSDAKRRAVEDMDVHLREINKIEAEMEAIYEGMSA